MPETKEQEELDELMCSERQKTCHYSASETCLRSRATKRPYDYDTIRKCRQRCLAALQALTCGLVSGHIHVLLRAPREASAWLAKYAHSHYIAFVQLLLNSVEQTFSLCSETCKVESIVQASKLIDRLKSPALPSRSSLLLHFSPPIYTAFVIQLLPTNSFDGFKYLDL